MKIRNGFKGGRNTIGYTITTIIFETGIGEGNMQGSIAEGIGLGLTRDKTPIEQRIRINMLSGKGTIK